MSTKYVRVREKRSTGQTDRQIGQLYRYTGGTDRRTARGQTDIEIHRTRYISPKDIHNREKKSSGQTDRQDSYIGILAIKRYT